MPQIGLALSGGGFRGTLYHLGVIRFLRDAGILPNVTHITSVSGGSILAAHLVLNWDRYNGSPEEFDKAAQEVINFARLDVRNRIVRRFPMLVFGQIVRWITRKPFDRKLTRTGLLEQYYEKYLYGDTCLYELPARPELHILATNLSEGCIGSFTRSGLIMERRRTGDVVEFERMQTGLATVPLAVASSSAFPGFFPPLVVRASDLGASKSAFSVLTFTDGGVFDNLGIRAFRFIEHCWAENCGDHDADGRQTKFVRVNQDGSPRSREQNGKDDDNHENADERDVRERAASGHDDNRSHRELIRRAELERSQNSAVAELDDDDEPREKVDAAPENERGGRLSGGFDAVIASDVARRVSRRLDPNGPAIVGHLDGPRLAAREGDLWGDARVPVRVDPPGRRARGRPARPLAGRPAPGFRHPHRP